MPTEDADRIIKWCGAEFESACFVCYEQVRVGDAFGAVMLAHLKKRGSPLRTCLSYPGLPDVGQRYLTLGYDVCTVLDMDDVYYRWLPGRPKTADAWRRSERMELFDEMEEWHMIQRHYSIAVACKDPRLRTVLKAPSLPASVGTKDMSNSSASASQGTAVDSGVAQQPPFGIPTPGGSGLL